jgi:O-antigen ligase
VGSATGTYVNRNHLGGLLVMAFPVVFALLIANVGRAAEGSTLASPGRHKNRRERGDLRHRLAELGALRMNLSLVYGGVVIAILLGLIFTRSRMSIGLAMLGLLLCMFAFSRRVGRNNSYGMLGTLTTVALVLAAVVGLMPVWDRFALQDTAADLRWDIFATTFQAIGQFVPLGSGFGTFANVYPRFQTPEVIGNINHTHNDYLEWIMEGGLVSAALVVGFGWFYVKRWTEVWYRGAWSTFRYIQVGAGISILLLALHGLVDFNFHIPANAIFFAFLAGVFFHRHNEEAREEEVAAARRKEIAEYAEEASKQSLDTSIPPENLIDPFA